MFPIVRLLVHVDDDACAAVARRERYILARNASVFGTLISSAAPVQGAKLLLSKATLLRIAGHAADDALQKCGPDDAFFGCGSVDASSRVERIKILINPSPLTGIACIPIVSKTTHATRRAIAFIFCIQN